MEQEVFKTGNRKYTFAIGRRKSATAQLRLYGKGTGKYVVNELELTKYLPTEILQLRAFAPLTLTNLKDIHDATIVVKGGGKRGQADAIKLAFARALMENDEALKPLLRQAGLLTRDAREKERKKPGLKRARRAPQWSKR